LEQQFKRMAFNLIASDQGDQGDHVKMYHI
jgi:hypothetical protein